MARAYTLQTAFTSGVLDPGLAARTDIQHYYQGASRGLNVLGVKEGGMKARWGRKYIGDVLGNGRVVEFSFNTEQNYVLVFTALRLEIYRDDVLVTNINGSGNDYLVTTFTETQCLELDYTQSADTLVITHQSAGWFTLQRGADHATWTLAALATSNIPKFDFNDADSPTPVNHVVRVTFNSFTDGDRYKLELNGFETPEIVYSSSDTTANARRIRDELLELPPTGFAESSITVAFVSGTSYDITFSGESADDYEDMTGRNTDSTSGSVTFSTTTTGSPRREEIVSATRGYPGAVTFFESRLLFAGLAQLPQSILGTIVGGFFPFNFKLGDGLDDQGIFVTLNTNQVNEIRALYPGRHLQLFTSGGEFYAPERPLTPAPALPRQSQFGIAMGLKPVEVDGATIFVTEEKKTIREYLFLWSEEAYNATSLSVLASHLLSGITSLAALTSTSDAEDSYVLVTNTDGTGAILNTLRSQDIAAWTEDQTRSGDKLKQVQVVHRSIYYLVERQRNGATVYQLEKADFDTRLDSSVKVTTGLGTTVSGFSALAGETVQVIVDGAPAADQTVSAAGELTFATAPTSSVEAGYFVAPIVTTMPLAVDMGRGPLMGVNKRLSEIRLKVKDSLGVIANGRKIPDKVIGTTQTATPDTPQTGVLAIRDMGYTRGDAEITLTQDQPLPFHVLGLTAELEVGEQ